MYNFFYNFGGTLKKLSCTTVIIFVLMSKIVFATMNCQDYTGIYETKSDYLCGSYVDSNQKKWDWNCIDVAVLIQRNCEQANVFKRKVILNPIPSQLTYGEDSSSLMPDDESLLFSRLQMDGHWHSRSPCGLSHYWQRGTISNDTLLSEEFDGCAESYYQGRASFLSDNQLKLERRRGVSDSVGSPPSQWSKWDMIAQWKKLNGFPEVMWEVRNRSSFNTDVLLKFENGGWVAHEKMRDFPYYCDGKDYHYFYFWSVLSEGSKTSDKWLIYDRATIESLLNSLDKSVSYLCHMKGDKPVDGSYASYQEIGESVVYNLENCQPYKAPSCCKVSPDYANSEICD